MPRVTLSELRRRDLDRCGVSITQYLFVPVDYTNASDRYAIIDDPHVITSVARDLDDAAAQCNPTTHILGCTCRQRTRSAERPMLILVET